MLLALWWGGGMGVGFWGIRVVMKSIGRRGRGGRGGDDKFLMNMFLVWVGLE